MDEAEWLAHLAAKMEPAKSHREAGPLRLYVRENFAALMSVKEQHKLSWSQMAEVLTKRGFTKANGDPLDGNSVAVTAAAVRWEKYPRSRKRRRARPKGAPAQAAPLGPLEIIPEPQTV